jgi:hypothetical protein
MEHATWNSLFPLYKLWGKLNHFSWRHESSNLVNDLKSKLIVFLEAIVLIGFVSFFFWGNTGVWTQDFHFLSLQAFRSQFIFQPGASFRSNPLTSTWCVARIIDRCHNSQFVCWDAFSLIFAFGASRELWSSHLCLLCSWDYRHEPSCPHAFISLASLKNGRAVWNIAILSRVPEMLYLVCN